MRKPAVIALLVAGVALAGIAGGALLLSSHRAPNSFTLTSPAAATQGPLAGQWQVDLGSQAGYRAREKFINQASPTEAVARTQNVTGGLVVRGADATLTATSIDFKVDLASLVSQDTYATYQAYQRDHFVSTIYLGTAAFPTAEFKADSVTLPVAGSGPASFKVPGKLSVHGNTKPVTADVTAQLTGSRIEVTGSVTVDMTTFGIEVPDISFTKAEPQVVIEFHIFLRRT